MRRQPFIPVTAPGIGGLARALRPGLIAVLLTLTLNACSGYQYVTDKLSAPIVLKCPDYNVLADAASLVKFHGGAGRDLVDVNYEGKITGVHLGCESDIDKQTKTGSMDVDVTLLFSANRGPANRDRKARFDYFISVVDPNRKILDRQAFPLVVTFPGNKTLVEFASKPVTFTLPITSQWPRRYYRIFVGLKLTHEQLRYNREKIQRRRK